MPISTPKVCGHCGVAHPRGQVCAAVKKQEAARKARFDAKRPSARQRGYDAEWERARRDFLLVYNSCRRCGAPASVVDHIKPHKGDDLLFWDRSNWQPLCASCHNSHKQRHERRDKTE